MFQVMSSLHTERLNKKMATINLSKAKEHTTGMYTIFPKKLGLLIP